MHGSREPFELSSSRPRRRKPQPESGETTLHHGARHDGTDGRHRRFSLIKIGLANLVYNFTRLAWLSQRGAPA
jgi:hypothetical protein